MSFIGTENTRLHCGYDTFVVKNGGILISSLKAAKNTANPKISNFKNDFTRRFIKCMTKLTLAELFFLDYGFI